MVSAVGPGFDIRIWCQKRVAFVVLFVAPTTIQSISNLHENQMWLKWLDLHVSRTLFIFISLNLGVIVLFFFHRAA